MERVRILAAALALLASSVLVSGPGAQDAAGTVGDCPDLERMVATMSEIRGSATRLMEGGDPETAYRVCRTGAQVLIRDHPDCLEIRRRLEGSLALAETLGRSSDRALAMLDSFDGTLEDLDAGSGDPGAAGTGGSGGEDGASWADSFQWFTDPYFLLLELILLAVLVVLREVRRIGRRRPARSDPQVRPFRYRVIPGGSSGRTGRNLGASRDRS